MISKRNTTQRCLATSTFNRASQLSLLPLFSSKACTQPLKRKRIRDDHYHSMCAPSPFIARVDPSTRARVTRRSPMSSRAHCQCKCHMSRLTPPHAMPKRTEMGVHQCGRGRMRSFRARGRCTIGRRCARRLVCGRVISRRMSGSVRGRRMWCIICKNKTDLCVMTRVFTNDFDLMTK
jgi:hypothetical protein